MKKKHQIDKELIDEIITILIDYKFDLGRTCWHTNYIKDKRLQANDLIEKLKATKKIKRFIFKVGFRK